MGTFMEVGFGYGLESTWGTATTSVDHFSPLLTESLDYRPNIKESKALFVGAAGVPVASRSIVVASDAGGDVELEIASKGQGLWWKALMGSGASTLVTSGVYQQNFTLTSSLLPSLTLQKSLPKVDGTRQAFTFSGAKCANFEIAFPQTDILTVKSTWDAKDVVTSVSEYTESYAVSSLFTMLSGTLYTGTLTEPTTTTLASGTTAVANVRGGTISVDHGLKGDRYTMGNNGVKSEQTIGWQPITGTLNIDFADTTWVANILTRSSLSFIGTWKTSTALGSDYETFQVVIPAIKLNGKMPFSNSGELITQTIDFSGYSNQVSTQPIWVISRTSDTAL